MKNRNAMRKTHAETGCVNEALRNGQKYLSCYPGLQVSCYFNLLCSNHRGETLADVGPDILDLNSSN